MSVDIHVRFTGTATVTVPDHLSKKDANLLARRIALARILATTENPDGPEEDAFDQYVAECSKKARKTAAKDWDCVGEIPIGGTWQEGDSSANKADPLCYFQCDLCSRLDTASTSDVKVAGHPMCPECDQGMSEITKDDYEAALATTGTRQRPSSRPT